LASKTNHWKLGLFVVVALAIALATVIALGLRRLNRDAYPLVTYFDESVQGLDNGSPVKFRGVTLGNVQSISVAPDHLHVEVWMRLYKDEMARMGFGNVTTRDSSFRPQLAAAGITGVKFVQFDNFPPDRYPEPLLDFTPPAEYYAPSVQSTLKSLEEVANEVLAKLPRIADELGDTLFEAKKSLRSVTDVAKWIRSDDSGLKRVVLTLDDAAKAIKQAIVQAELSQTTSSVRGAASSVNAAAGKLGGEAGQLDETLRGLREALEAVRALAARLDRDPTMLIRGRAVQGAPEEKR
jgi:phospholipid/cholesterol/gamma-HCH transport system substrate-binding protein